MPVREEIREFSRAIPALPKKTWPENLNEIQRKLVHNDAGAGEDHLSVHAVGKTRERGLIDLWGDDLQ